jgi:catechol 2,3-dioxygenase-like lactoylglutathione lyase family enzyme
MIDHISFAVSDVARSKPFYDRLLGAIGIGVMMEVPAGVTASGGATYGYGAAGKPYFWIADNGRVGQGAHVAFAVESRALVDAFHAAGLEAGGTDNGAPGLRPHYHADYYGAFILDPDGINVEAVCHKAQ